MEFGYEFTLADEAESTKSIHHLYNAVFAAVEKIEAAVKDLDERIAKIEAKKPKKAEGE